MTERAGVARHELEQYTLLYADRQLVESGDFEAVAERLVRRSRLRLVGAVVAAVVFAAILFSTPGLDALPWVLFCLVGGATDYLVTRRTLAAVRRLGVDATTTTDEPGPRAA